MKLWPVYIQSAGRPVCPTARLFERGTTNVVVEPREAAAYAAMDGHKVFVLPGDQMGLPRARQAVLDEAERRGDEWFWLLDDDITGFYTAALGKTTKCAASRALAIAQEMFLLEPCLAQGGLEYQQFAWSSRNGFALDSYCDVAVCLHVKRCKQAARFNAELPLKGDRDFTMQLLAAGWSTMRCARAAFAAPKNGSNKGGLSAIYAQDGAERAECERMVAKWGNGICRVIRKKDGRTDVKIAWNRLSSRIASRKLL